MQKLLLFVTLQALVLLSCNEANKQTPAGKDSASRSGDTISAGKFILSTDCPGAGNYYIRTGEADSMITHFGKIYAGGKQWQPVFIDQAILEAAATLLHKDEFDGIRFYPAIDIGSIPTIELVPTKPIAGCEQGKTNSCHADTFGKKLLGVPVNTTEYRLYDLDKASFNKKKDAFRSKYPPDSISQSVWICKAVFFSLEQKINDGEIDGINVHFAAYKGRGKCPSQQYDNQSTIVIITTKGGVEDPITKTKQHKEVPEVIQNDKNFNPFAAYNHGELCPNFCQPH